MEPVLVVLVSAAGATLVAAAGVLPLIGRRRASNILLGWSNAAAAGAMLGIAYILASIGIGASPPALGLGALLGIGFIWWGHEISGTAELELNKQGAASARYGSDVLLVSALHSGAEGLAIGAAMAVDLRLGVGMAVAIGVHNIPEATLLSSVFRSRGEGAGRALLLSLVSNFPIVPMAVSTFALVVAAPAAGPWALGFASGALIYLVAVDLLPESYRQAGKTSIAMVALLAMGMVASLRELSS